MAFLLLMVGVVLLYLGGEVLVGGAAHLARALGISPLVIGLTVVAFATSAPELCATLIAVLHGAPALSLGNVFGSNIANVALILGLAAIIRPLAGQDRFLRREIPILIGVAVIPLWLLRDGVVSRIEGMVMVLLLVAYVVHLLREGRPSAIALEEVEEELAEAARPWWLSALAVAVGLGMLVWGADILVSSATTLARAIGISERVIGLTLVAFGTSLPELASSLAAARRREGDIVLGNIVGSNIFNVLCVLGVTAMVRPIAGDPAAVRIDLLVGLALSLALVPMLLFGRRLYLGRFEGFVLLAAYGTYVGWLFL